MFPGIAISTHPTRIVLYSDQVEGLLNFACELSDRAGTGLAMVAALSRGLRVALAMLSVFIIMLTVFPVVNVVNAQTFTRVGALTLNPGENPSSAVIDSANGYAYFGTGQGTVVKVRLSDFTYAGSLTLNSGSLSEAVIDSANGFAYFGTGAFPGVIVKVRLSDFTRVGALTLNTQEGYLKSAVLDSVNGYAYFGTYTSPAASPGVVVKVRLSDFTRVVALTLNPAESVLYA